MERQNAKLQIIQCEVRKIEVLKKELDVERKATLHDDQRKKMEKEEARKSAELARFLEEEKEEVRKEESDIAHTRYLANAMMKTSISDSGDSSIKSLLYDYKGNKKKI